LYSKPTTPLIGKSTSLTDSVLGVGEGGTGVRVIVGNGVLVYVSVAVGACVLVAITVAVAVGNGIIVAVSAGKGITVGADVHAENNKNINKMMNSWLFIRCP
jgi:hypothetical protein